MLENDYLIRVGIKGTVTQLKSSTRYLYRLLCVLEEPSLFSVEIHLSDKGDVDDKEKCENLIKEFSKVAENFRKEAGGRFIGVTLHIPFVFRKRDFNLASFENKIWKNSIELIRVMLEMAGEIEKRTGIKAKIVVHGYGLKPFEHGEGGIEKKHGLYELNHSYKLSKVYDALEKFSPEERKKIGIETTGTGPCSSPDDLIYLAEKLNCFIVQDVAHLLRRYHIDKDGEMHEREYNDPKILIPAIKKMLPYTEHWHICQHHGGWRHDDWHLAMPGIIDWPSIIPYILESFREKDATATIEVNSQYKDYDFNKPLVSFGSFFLFREIIKEKLFPSLKG
jgi:hypothetical protein